MTTVRTEIRKRDGLARIGIATIDGTPVKTPAVLDTTEFFPSLLSMKHTNVPLFSPEGFVREYSVQSGDQPVTIHPLIDNPAKSEECVMVANWHTAFSNPRNYVDWLEALKSKTPPDTTWYAPGTALPSNVHILTYSGFDLFDFRAVDLKAAQGIFCTLEGEFTKTIMNSGICSCEGCRTGSLKLHNRQALLREIALVTRFIEQGQLRELVESRCRMHAPHVSILRHLDARYGFMEPYAPIGRGSVMLVNSGESMNRPEIRRFAERVTTRYLPPKSDVCVLLPCSAKKPYSLSRSHHRFQAAVAHRAHELIVTSPLGLVPRELETVYPAGHYDVPVTGYWDAEECAVIAGVIGRYFERNRYRRIIAHLDGGALIVAEMAAEACAIEMEYSCRDRPADDAALERLHQALSGERRIKDDRLHGMCSYQFGIDLDTRGFSVRGRFPEIFFMKNNVQCFSVDIATGLLRPTFEGWNLIPSGCRVIIDDFIPEGDVLVPGVVSADPAIREGDEVLVTGPRAWATGKAAMSGDEMRRSHRGVAVRVRKVKKLQIQSV
ncbi:MAG: archaeosine synthase subunit alpha [Methanoregula sp.]|nr:MAG: archaeosine synthase subunit alpha [Methanoregula sp.]